MPKEWSDQYQGKFDAGWDVLREKIFTGRKEGHPERLLQRRFTFNGLPGVETTEFLLSNIDDFGTPWAYNHNAVGWAHTFVHAVSVDQADRLTLGRHPQRRHRVMAEGFIPIKVRVATSFTTSVLRDHGHPQHLSPGLDRDDLSTALRGCTDAPPFANDIWELYGPEDWTQAHRRHGRADTADSGQPEPTRMPICGHQRGLRSGGPGLRVTGRASALGEIARPTQVFLGGDDICR